MRSLAARCLPLLIALCASPALAQTIPCGEPYIVRPGDTLQRIARRAYGPDATFRDLLGPNRDAFINGDPSLIAVGQEIAVPCRDITATGDPTDAAPPPLRLALMGSAMPTGASRVLDEAAIRAGLPDLVWNAPRFRIIGLPPPPYTRAAAAEQERQREREPFRLNLPRGADLPSALAALPGPAVAAAVPRPDCKATGQSAAVASVCDGLLWSAPLAESVISTFTRGDEGLITQAATLHGRKLCTVPNVPDYMLASFGTDRSPERYDNARSCLLLLRTGVVDAAVIPAVEADAAMADLPPGAALTEQFALAQLATLHAVALPDSTEAAEALGRLDAALADMRRDGTWIALVTGEATRN